MAGAGRVGCWGSTKLASGLWGAAPASNPWSLHFPLPKCHMRKGLQLGVPSIPQHQCRELSLPAPQQTPCSWPREQAVFLLYGGGSFWVPVAGPGQSANSGRCGLEAAPGRGLGRTPSRAPPRGQADDHGPEVLNVSSMNTQVCASLWREGVGRCR